MTASPTLATVIRRAIAAALTDVHTSMPARVESYDDATMTCSAQPLIKRGYKAEGGARQAEILPVIQNVPVMFPGGGGRSFKFPLAAGDTVLLLFCESSLDRGFGGLVDPEDDRRHSLNDAVAIPFATSGDEAPLVEVTAGGQIHVGGSAALATKADLEALISTFNTHTHVYSPGPGAAAPTAPPATPASASTGTTILKGS